ncbi:MAG: hypothetical protein DRJ10_17645 [Bacteroidetes bacterium]|nr:MAG: hypothetical protein DRJ10_17645 [Bacteroidota bacterium]
MENNNNPEEKDYNISFFKPTTPLAKFNRNLIIGLFTVWAVAIFGFQILLRIVETPTPEKAYENYELVWDDVKSGNASVADKQVFIKSVLSVLGKITIDPNDRLFLSNSVNKLTLGLVPETEKNAFTSKIVAFKNSDFDNPDYQELKNGLSIASAGYIGVSPNTLEAKLIPFELITANSKTIDSKAVESIMAKYLIHNQSFITDYYFLGFPFHYFYTAVFLLILFVGLCLYYCIATDIAMKKLGIVED